MAVGTRIHVHGRGQGEITGFKRSTFGANDHIIAFDNGTNLTMKLRRYDEWVTAVTADGVEKLVEEDVPPLPLDDIKLGTSMCKAKILTMRACSRAQVRQEISPGSTKVRSHKGQVKKLEVGTVVHVLERRESEGHQRVR